MFSPDIVCSDAFLDMPMSSQALYYQLGMKADDDGFVNPRGTMRMLGASEDDLKILLAKRFLLAFEEGVVVLKHWLIHNLIRADLYKETPYKRQKNMLGLNNNGAYTELRDGVTPIKPIEAPKWLKIRRGEARTANVPQTALRLGKVRLENTVAEATPIKEKTMKKNRMGSYREDAPQDSYDESIDIDTGEAIKPKKRESVLPAYKELMDWAEKQRGRKFMPGTEKKQYKAFRDARTFGLNPAELKRRWLDMEDDKFWAGNGFDWMNVVYSFNKKPK